MTCLFAMNVFLIEINNYNRKGKKEIEFNLNLMV